MSLNIDITHYMPWFTSLKLFLQIHTEGVERISGLFR